MTLLALDSISTWTSRQGTTEYKGFKKGMAAGLEKGKTHALDRLRRMVLKRIDQRFGAVPEPVQARVQAITSIETLARMFEKVPSLRSAESLLPRRNGKARSAA